MRRLQPVIWSKGTFLSPQHLQVQDQFVESTLEFRQDALTFRPWGFSKLQIDQEALAAGNFALTSAAGIFPDGLTFDIPNSDPAPPLKQLAQFYEPRQETLDVYLAIPEHRLRGLNVASARQNVDARYLREAILVRDENSGVTEKLIEVARKNFRVLVEGESRVGASALRMARVKRTPSGIFQLDYRFVPPLLNLSANDYLYAILRRLVELLSAKSSTLGGLRRQRNQSLAEFTSADIANFWLLYTANSFLPGLRHLFETKKGHPEGLFSLMTSLAGALTTFSNRIQPRDLPAYDHDKLEECFTELDEKLRDLLESVVPSNFVSLPLKLVQPSIYATAIANDKYLRNTKMYLAISAEMKEADLIRRAPQLLKVGSANQIETLVRQALLGIPLTHVPKPPGSLPIKLNYQYFSLNQSGDEWEAIGRGRNLAVYVPGDFPSPQLELLILLPQPA
jgi:type VI secretion system protein ImpJ